MGTADSRERALAPGGVESLPGLAEVPTVVPGAVFLAVLAQLVDHGGPADERAKSIGFAQGECRHGATVAVTDEREALGVDGEVLDRGIYAGHDVAVVLATEVIPVGRQE